MDPSGPPSPFSYSLSSPTKTPHPSSQKTLNSSPTSNSSQRHSPERQCACPCEPFESKLKAAITLMSFRLHPVPMLHPVPYPSDTITGKHIPVAELRKYSRTHVWPDGMHCFCSLCAGVEPRSVCLFILQGSPCLGCPYWTEDGTSGCRYFVNLDEFSKDGEYLFKTDVVPLHNFPLRDNNRKRTQTHLASSGAHLSASAVSPISEPGPSASKSSALDVQDSAPFKFRVKPLSISDPARVRSPPSQDFSLRIEDVRIPANSEVQEILDEMLNGPGVSYHQFMAIVGSCIVCNQIMVLPNILTHPCLGRIKEPGPHPSKYPRLLEDRRVLPTAGSRIKEPNAMQATIGANLHGDDNDAEYVDKINNSPTRKRKFNHPSQHVFICPTKKPRITNIDGPSSAMPVFTQSAEIVDLTGSPTRLSTPVPTQPTGTVDVTSLVRLLTPEGSREVYHDVDEGFIMYEKA